MILIVTHRDRVNLWCKLAGAPAHTKSTEHVKITTDKQGINAWRGNDWAFAIIDGVELSEQQQYELNVACHGRVKRLS